MAAPGPLSGGKGKVDLTARLCCCGRCRGAESAGATVAPGPVNSGKERVDLSAKRLWKSM